MGSDPPCPKRKRPRQLIELEAIVVAYAMSRLDKEFLTRFSFKTWQEAFEHAGAFLGVPKASMKNLRDEFDPIHPNSRKGWHKRPLRANRQRVLGEFCDTSDEALIEVVSRLLRGDMEVEATLTHPMATPRAWTENVAERLRTGRLAEEYFLRNSQQICGFPQSQLVDCRNDARGFDFGVAGKSRLAIEVKGLRLLRGEVLFTDCEWVQAVRRKTDYWLVVVGSVHRDPYPRLIRNAAASLTVVSSIRRSIALTWRASIVLR